MEDSSNDAVEFIDSQDEQDPEGGEKRPIMVLLRRLIRNKQNTVMTNTQIIDILQSELNICVESSHELEVDIYIKIIKKYLKDWPQWEELERIATKLNNIKDYEAVTKVLNHKYRNLKEYLGVMLEAAKPLAKDAVKSLTVTPETTRTDENNYATDVVMEIQCSREQLNHLFFRRPRLDLNNTVFNMSDVAPSRISLKSLNFEQILYGWSMKVTINLPQFSFVREVSYKLKHVLVNKVRYESVTTAPVQTCLQTLQRDHLNKSAKTHSRDIIIKQFGDILSACASQSYELYESAADLFEILKSELKDTFERDTLYKVPASYRRFATKYKYVRYLYADNDSSEDKRYDLQLEETMAPVYSYVIGRLGKIEKIPPVTEWLMFECMACKTKIPMNSPCVKTTLEAHFNDLHQNEQDWQCTHCKKSFSIDYLTNNKWYHEC